jgi:hypothetical protein
MFCFSDVSPLYSSRSDEIVLTVGSKSQVLSLAYMPLISPLAPTDCSSYDKEENKQPFSFESRVHLETAVPGMTLRTVLPEYQPPPGLSALKGAATTANGPSMGGGDDKPPAADNSFMGFMKRYWYVLLPMLIMQFMQAQAPAEEAPPEGQQPQVAGAGAAPAAAAPADGAARKRRGKRG